MSPLSKLLRYDYFFNTAALCLSLFLAAVLITTFSMILHYVIFFHAAVL